MTNCEKGFFVNLHAPYDLVYIKLPDSEYTFDKSGRLMWIIKDDAKIERNLNNKFVLKSDIGFDYLYKKNRVLSYNESSELYKNILHEIQFILNTMKSEPHCSKNCDVYKHEKDIIPFLEKIISYDFEALLRDEQNFNSIYSPIEIFPSDIPHPIIVQLTQGCSYNKCTFCYFYKNRCFKIKNLEELQRHIFEIKEFLGDSIFNKRSIFLGDANALTIEYSLLISMLDIVRKEFPIVQNYYNENRFILQKNKSNKTRFDGIYSFIDAMDDRKLTLNQFKELKKRNLEKIYIGLESGSNRVLSFIKKCNTVEQLIDITQTIKQADIKVGIMIIAGIGGDKYYNEHVNETIKVIEKLNLNTEDTINFSHLVLSDKASYKQDIIKNGIKKLTYDQEQHQIDEIVTGLKISTTYFPNIRGYEVENVRF